METYEAVLILTGICATSFMFGWCACGYFESKEKEMIKQEQERIKISQEKLKELVKEAIREFDK